MDHDPPTDLLQPMAGPSQVSRPINLLTAPVDVINAQVIRASLANQPDADALYTCSRFLTTRPVTARMAHTVLQEAFNRIESSALPPEPSVCAGLPTSTDIMPIQRLYQLRDRLETYSALTPHVNDDSFSTMAVRAGVVEKIETEDPWETGSAELQDLQMDPTSSEQGETDQPTVDFEGFPSLHAFLSEPLLDTALTIASHGDTHSLSLLYQRHESELSPNKLMILDALPPWVHPSDISSLCDNSTSAVPLCDWYLARVDYLDRLGMLDSQLSWVQHGASMGIPGLDAVGEELSFLSRLIYDSRLSATEQAAWCLASWRRSDPDTIIRAYLKHPTPSTMVEDIRRLVLPYLFYLESKAERAGEPHSHLVANHLHDLVLSLDLELALPLFEASKATIPTSERIIADDQIVARLALACLYGSNKRDDWATMSSIFECLPVWDVSGGDLVSDKEATSMTLDSIATFVRPTSAGTHPPTAKDLFIFFSPLPFASLSRALDILDVHLESGEILARWNTPVQLRFLLQSARNKSDQQDLAERMVRRQVAGPHTEQRWTALWNDFKKLSGGADSMLRGAFGSLSIEESLKIYLGGLLSSGAFSVAKRVIQILVDEDGFTFALLQSVVLQTAREFYENAESGNLNTGEMKLAYECLSVAESSDSIQEEREFIEATSRLTTFAIRGRGRLSPLEIRHAKSRLTLVKQVVESSEDAYRHPELVLELTDKLGYKGDKAARVQVLAALAQSATRHGNFDAAYAHTQSLFRLTAFDTGKTVWRVLFELGQQAEYPEIDKRMKILGQALEVCPPEEVPSILNSWRKVEDGQGKLCDAAKRRRITGIRSSVRPLSASISPSHQGRVLGSRTAARAARLAMGFAGNQLKGIASSPLLSSSPTIPQGGGPDFSEGAVRKSNESDRPNFGALLDSGAVKAGTAEAERVRQQARKALVRGVGWLLGADERDLEEG